MGDTIETSDSAWSAWSRSVDHATLGACLILFTLGVILAFAASPALAARLDLEPFAFAWRQLMFGAPAFGALIALSFLSPNGARRAGLIIAAVGFLAMALLMVDGVEHQKAATRWLSIAGLSIQPSEFLKPGLVVVCGWMLSSLAETDRNVAFGGAALAAATMALAVALLVWQPDYGQSALLLAVWCAMFFVAGGSIWALGVVGGLVALGALAAYESAPHFAARVDAFLGASGPAQLQLTQAEDAIVNGGWFGRGLGEGVAKARLPDAHADFILAVAAEEYGFLMVALVIALFLFIVLQAMTRLWRSEDPFARVAGLGLSLLIGLQALVHIAVSAQLAPVTGMTLPFVSYGGSSLVATGLSVGLLLALTRRRPRDLTRILP